MDMLLKPAGLVYYLPFVDGGNGAVFNGSTGLGDNYDEPASSQIAFAAAAALADLARTLLLTVLVLSVLVSMHVARMLPDVPEVHCVPTNTNLRLLQGCAMLKEPYQPPLLWGWSGHVQTLLFSVFGRFGLPHRSATTHKERFWIDTLDKSKVIVDVFSPSQDAGLDTPIIFVIPGISNHSDNTYIRGFVHAVNKAGYRAIVFNHHGASRDEPIAAARLFTIGGIDDVVEAFHFAMDKYPSAKMIAVGFSMGGNLALRLAGLHDHIQQRLSAVLSICQGYDVIRGTTALEKVPLYNSSLVKGLQRLIRSHESYFKTSRPDLDLASVYKAQTMSEFDRVFTVPTNPHLNSVDEYYRSHGSKHILPNLRIPTLLVNTHDDPIMASELLDVPKAAATTHSNIIFVSTRFGGHLGYYEGTFLPKTLSWIDRLIVSYVDAL